MTAKREPVIENPKEIVPTEFSDFHIEVYFCPRENCTLALLNLLKSANSSIHCALYDLDLTPIINFLYQSNLDIKIVTDTDNYENIEHLNERSSHGAGEAGEAPSGVPSEERSDDSRHDWLDFEQIPIVKHDNRSALMHNKFCIIDNRVIFTGSFNPTNNCAYRNNNNMLIIHSRYLSENYEAEFQELWSGTFGKGNPTPYPVIYLNGKRIENHFCPEDNCAYQIQKHIRTANRSIYFTAFSFTHPSIAIDLVIKHRQGIDIKGVFEKTRISNYSMYHLLKYQGINVSLDKNKYVMHHNITLPINYYPKLGVLHHKFFVIDNRTVITGSFNPSANADTRNDENIIIIEDPEIASEFLHEFELIWARSAG
ncbi:MAG: phospholipase D-like domain-containing protein [Candidatus Woesearchaeota archaeon]